MKEIIGTLREFVEFVNEVSVPCLFRGQANALYELQPGIGRPHPEYCPTQQLEEALLGQFKNRARLYLNHPLPTSDWDWMVIAQHHGLKTRLLDWTTDWRIALYFATIPHEKMHRVPLSVFVLESPKLTPYDKLPQNPFTCKRDYFFQPPHIHGRVAAQSSYLSAHCKPQQCVNHSNLLQFSFHPFPEHRRQYAHFLASNKTTAAEVFPGMDGICRSLVDEPRITAQIELQSPPTRPAGEWLKVPPSSWGKKVGTIRKEILQKRTLELVLDWIGVERLIGIPCYIENRLFGFLKYGDYAHTKFVFLLATGDKTVTVRYTDKDFKELKLLQEHIEKMLPSKLMFCRPIQE